MTEGEQGAYGPSWYAATMVAVPERRALTHDLDVDACVIGAGLAGLTVARELARHGWSVAVLEAQRVAAGASGRNGGFVSPGFSERIEAIVERVGLPRAKELWALSDAGVEYMRQAIAETAMPGPETTNRAVIARTLAGQAAIRTVERAMEAAGGVSFYRGVGLERAFRDVQGARFHPLQEKAQLRYTGRLALGLDIDG